jgi:aryl-alcohol dehydrogenase-like predicted oxidoreductase
MPMAYGVVPGVAQRVSRLVLGGGEFSAAEPARQELACALLDTFVAHGGTLVDTAAMYGRGSSERAIGEWLRRRGSRNDALLLTKGAHFSRGDTGRLQPAEIAFDLGQSLERLGTGYVDLYLLHRDDEAVPVGPIVETLNEQAARGRINAFGASNWTHRRLDEANEYAAVHGLTPFAIGSPQLSLAVPKEPMWPGCLSVAGDAAALRWYRHHKFPLLAWSSQATGFFSGRFASGRAEGAPAAENAEMMRVYDDDGNWERLRRTQQLAGERGCTPTQIALAWVLNQPELNVFAAIGPRSLTELESSLAAIDIVLTPAEVAWLNLQTNADPAQ